MFGLIFICLALDSWEVFPYVVVINGCNRSATSALTRGHCQAMDGVMQYILLRGLGMWAMGQWGRQETWTELPVLLGE